MPDGSKWCWGCDAVKPKAEFHNAKGKSDGLQGACKECQYSRYRQRLADNPEAVREVSRRSQKKHRRRRIYGMDEEQFLIRLAEQGGVCAGCQRTPTKPVLDHDHACCGPNRACEKCLRWILCSGCNSVLGFAEDNPDTLERLAAMLRQRSAAKV